LRSVRLRIIGLRKGLASPFLERKTTRIVETVEEYSTEGIS